jgi:ABC-type dipeptide/oligopeptide/nickel transport system permease subunit
MTRGALGARFAGIGSSSWGSFWAAQPCPRPLLAPWLAPFDPRIGDLRNAYLLEPGGRDLLGTDTQGRDGHESVKGEA